MQTHPNTLNKYSSKFGIQTPNRSKVSGPQIHTQKRQKRDMKTSFVNLKKTIKNASIPKQICAKPSQHTQ